MKNISSLQVLFEFFESYSDVVYISDMETDSLVFVNAAGRKAFHVTQEQVQSGTLKCYSMMQNRISPCETCNNARLEEGTFHTWSYRSPSLHLYLTLRDTLIVSDGRRYRLEIATDSDEEHTQHRLLTEMTANERIINEALDIALNEIDPERSINAMLAYLGQQLHGDRVYIFEENSRGNFDNTYEWCRDGVTPEKDNLQDGPREVIQVWYDEFDRHKNILIRDLEEYRNVSRPMYDILKPQDIHSLVVGPLVLNGRRIGFYGVDNPPYEMIETISTMYEVLGHFISALLRHRDNVAKLQSLSCYDQMTGLQNRHALDLYLKDLDRTKSLCYYFCDLNGLKKANDLFGHRAGDRLICSAASILRDFFGGIPVFRMGGDEFLAIESDIPEEKAKEKEAALREAFKREHVSTALGIVWKSDGTESFDSLFKEADARMYADKRAFYGDRRKHSKEPGEPRLKAELPESVIQKASS